MAHIGALSRAPVDTKNELIGNKLGVMLIMTEEEYVITMQRIDQQLRKIIDNITNDLDNQQKLSDYILRNDILYKKVLVKGEECLLWMVPNAMRKAIVTKFDDQMGHFAVDRTVDKILKQYYFLAIRRYVRYHINCCPVCVG